MTSLMSVRPDRPFTRMHSGDNIKSQTSYNFFEKTVKASRSRKRDSFSSRESNEKIDRPISSFSLHTNLKRKYSHAIGQNNNLNKFMNFYLDPKMVKDIEEIHPSALMKGEEKNKKLSKFGSINSLKLPTAKGGGEEEKFLDLPNLNLHTSSNTNNNTNTNFTKINLNYNDSNYNTLTTDPNSRYYLQTEPTETNSFKKRLAVSSAITTSTNISGSVTGSTTHTNKANHLTQNFRKGQNIEQDKPKSLGRNNSIKFPNIFPKSDKTKEEENEKDSNHLDTKKRRSDFQTHNFSSLASKNTDTNTNNMDNSHFLDIPKINSEIKYLLNHKKDKKNENNLNQYEIKISPENENKKIEESLSEVETEQNLYKSAKTEKATKDNLARFEHLKNKLSNNNKNNLKNLDTTLSNKNGENNIKSPTKIVINRAQTKTKLIQMNNQENMDNFNINVIKTPNENNSNFDKNSRKKNEVLEENHKSDSENSNSSTEVIKDKKFTFLSRAVNLTDNNRNFEDQLENDVNKDKVAYPDIVVNGPDEEDMPIVESNDPKATKGTSGVYKTFNKNFMRQLSRISEISNYFSRDNDSNPNNSFESASIIKTKKKHTTKDAHFSLKEPTEEQELKWNLQIINLKDDKSKESIEQIDEKEDENFVNDSNRVDIQIVSDASSVSNNYKKNLFKRKQTMDIVHNDNASSADSEVSLRPLVSKMHYSSKILPKYKNVELTPKLNRVERRGSDSRIVYSKAAESNINFSILGRDAKFELLKERQKEGKIIYSNKINKNLDKIEHQIKKEKNKINDKFTKYIHERCEKNLLRNYKKKKYDKVIKSFHTGVGELYLLEYINGNKEKEIIPNSGSSSELLSLTVQTEYIDYILNTYFEFSSLKLILKSMEKNIESDSNNKITLIRNFQYDENEKVDIKKDPTLLRMKTLAKNNEFLSRSIISKEAKDFFNNPNIPKNDKNYSIAYFRLGVNNLVFYNKFLYLDLPEKENDANQVTEYLNFDSKKEVIENTETINKFKNDVKRRKTQGSIARKNSVRFNNMVMPFNKKENDPIELENINSNNENSNSDSDQDQKLDRMKIPKKQTDKSKNKNINKILKTKEDETEIIEKLFPKKYSLLANPNFFGINSKANMITTNPRWEEYQQILNIRRLSLFNSPLKFNKKAPTTSLGKDEEKHKPTKIMNKESMLFRTHEIKSQILKQNAQDPIQNLFFYIKDDNFQKFKEILEKKKLPLEEVDEEGNTLLNLAVQCNSFNIVNYLINNGANVNTQNHKLSTPLHYALSHKNFKIADMLIKRHADESIQNKSRLTPWQCLLSTETLI